MRRKTTFLSLISDLYGGSCPYFYLISPTMSVLFIADRINNNNKGQPSSSSSPSPSTLSIRIVVNGVTPEIKHELSNLGIVYYSCIIN